MIRFLVFFSLFLSTAPFCKKQTDGFAVNKVATCLLEQEDAPLDHSLLDQPYRYMGKGGQAYVFASEDGRFVLKLFRGSRASSLKAMQHIIPLFSAKIKKEEAHILETLGSYLLARDKLPNETGLIATHLGGTGPCSIKIIDKLGIKHTIDGSMTPFIIQKRACLVKDKIDEAMRSHQLDEAKRLLLCLLSLLDRQYAVGVIDSDPNLCKNFGFVGSEPIEIDGGRYSLSNIPCFERLGASKEDFQNWLSSRYPELSTFFEETYQLWIQTHEAN